MCIGEECEKVNKQLHVLEEDKENISTELSILAERARYFNQQSMQSFQERPVENYKQGMLYNEKPYPEHRDESYLNQGQATARGMIQGQAHSNQQQQFNQLQLKQKQEREQQQQQQQQLKQQQLQRQEQQQQQQLKQQQLQQQQLQQQQLQQQEQQQQYQQQQQQQQQHDLGSQSYEERPNQLNFSHNLNPYQYQEAQQRQQQPFVSLPESTYQDPSRSHQVSRSSSLPHLPTSMQTLNSSQQTVPNGQQSQLKSNFVVSLVKFASISNCIFR